MPTNKTLDTLASSTQWRRLLHYSKGLLSDRSKVRGDKFFLSNTGQQNPRHELTATLEGMTSPDLVLRKKIQCQFPARREFILKNIPEFQTQVVSCPELEQWLNKLSADKISLIFASGYLNSAPSSFGHTFLKLQSVKNQGKELLNYGINFSARTDEQDGVLYAWKGLLGFFPANFSLIQYHLMIKEYVNLEGRDLWEYELNLTPEEIRILLYHMLELELGYFDYYFIDENCSSMILNILQIARPGLELISDDEPFVIPIDTLKPLSSLVVDTIYRPSLKTIFAYQWSLLDDSQKNKIDEFLTDRKHQISDLDVRTIDALQSWVSLKEAKDTLGFRDLSYQIALERAKVNQITDAMPVPIPKDKPTSSHDSSQVGVGVYRTSQKTISQISLLPAFHERAARSQGLPPFSEIKILNLELFLDKEVKLKNLDLIQVLSNSPIHRLEKPISWGFSVGESRYFLGEQEQHQRALGHLGYALAGDDFCILVSAKAGMQQVLEAKLEALAGPSAVVWINLPKGFRAVLEAEKLIFKGDHLLLQQYQLAKDLNADYWISLGWQSRATEGFRSEETSLFLKFLF